MEVTQTTVLDWDCVQVNSTGPRGGPIETILHFDRRGKPKYGYREKGNPNGCLKSAQVPQFMWDAALKAISEKAAASHS